MTEISRGERMSMRPILVAVPVLVAGLAVSGTVRTTVGTIPPAACQGAEYHQFDFFAGDWDAYDIGAPTKLVAHNRVTPMVGGCALREVYEQNDGLVGESFSMYDAGRGLWHQSWVTNHGTLLQLDGRLEATRMVLTGSDNSEKGKQALIRGIWYREGKGVRETAVRSIDGGKSWTPVFDILFLPKGSTP